MTNNKQQTAVDVSELAMKLYPFSNLERNAFITGYNKAKEMEKERIIKGYANGHNDGCRYMNNEKQQFEHGEQYYEQTYGGGEQWTTF